MTSKVIFVAIIGLICIFSRFTAYAIECKVGLNITANYKSENQGKHFNNVTIQSCSNSEGCSTFELQGDYKNGTQQVKFHAYYGRCLPSDQCQGPTSCPHNIPLPFSKEINVTSCHAQCCHDTCSEKMKVNLTTINNFLNRNSAATINTSTTEQPVANNITTSSAEVVTTAGPNANSGNGNTSSTAASTGKTSTIANSYSSVGNLELTTSSGNANEFVYGVLMVCLLACQVSYW